MKLLLISHNCLSRTSSMGKTLMSYFGSFQKEELAQLYIHCEEPTDDSLCQNYYRFTDTDALRSLFSCRELGSVFGKENIHTERVTARTDTGWLTSVYRFGEKRTPIGYLLRELLWKCSRWETNRLWEWIREFDPDVIFFASGDYGFSYEIARRIASRRGTPLVVCCMDDYYLYNRNEKSLLGRLVHGQFRKTLRKTMARACGIFTICDSLREAYEPLFGRKCWVLPTSAQPCPNTGSTEGTHIAYLGNLELNRDRQLVSIGRALQEMALPGGPRYLDVYSSERDPKILREMTMENGIRFHGAVSAEGVQEVMNGCMAVIHTESFEPRIQRIVRHSMSTKIPESLMNGPCLIAYGPEGIASMDYLKENGAAYLITDPRQLKQGLQEILTDAALRQTIVGRARETARKYHSAEVVPARLRRQLEEICAGQWEYEGFTD